MNTQPQQQPGEPQLYKMLKVTISGTYKTHDGEIIDFDALTGVIPFTSEEHAAMHVRGRYVDEWIRGAKNEKGDKKYPRSVAFVARCYIDDIETVEGTPSFLGKDIRNLSTMELQDLATAKDLRAIPVPRDCGDKRAARERAYRAYHLQILHRPKMKPDVGEEGFNLMKLPKIILTDAEGRLDNTVKVDNETVLKGEQMQGKATAMGSSDDPKNRLSLKDLKELADGGGVEYDEGLDEDKLYSELYSKLFGAK